MKDLECPYCGAGHDVCHDDGFGYAEGVNHEMECDECGKTFVFTTCISYTYHPEKAPCLNGGEHQFGGWFRVGGSGEFEEQIRRCSCCDVAEYRTIKTP